MKMLQSGANPAMVFWMRWFEECEAEHCVAPAFRRAFGSKRVPAWRRALHEPGKSMILTHTV